MAKAARVVAAVLASAALLLATSCTRVIHDARVVAAPDMGKARATAADCSPVNAPLRRIPGHGDDEPVMRIPQPPGWQRVTMMDSDVIRFAMRNVGLARGGFAPTAVVTLESHQGSAEPKDVFSAQHDALRAGVGARNVQITETTLCALPAEIIDYTTPKLGILPPHPARVLCAVLQTGDRTFAMTMTVQSADPDNPKYKRDAEAIITGFQMLPPKGA